MNTGQFAGPVCERFRRQPGPGVVDPETLHHLESCLACRQVWEARTHLRSRLKVAVERQQVPPELRARIRELLSQRQSRAQWGVAWQRWALAAAASLVACASVWLARPAMPMPSLADRPGQEAYIQRVSATVAVVLQLGLGDHIHCSVFRKYPQNPPTVAEMQEKLGPAFQGVLPLAQAAVPEGYRVIMAHHCGYAGRKYTHLTLRKGSDLISLVIARKNPGESLHGLSPALSPSGIPVYQSAAQRYAVAGFEAGGYFAFVVSELRGKTNLQIAANLAPTLYGFLMQAPA